MIYARNKHTGEHRLDDGMKTDDEEWVIADEDGWIPFKSHAKAEPPMPEHALGDYKLASGTVFENAESREVGWNYEGNGRIIAYRPILAAEPSEPEAPEWPQPGDKAELHNEPGYLVAYGDSAIGEEVEVLAVFYSDAIKMAAVEHDGSCYCFRAEMLRPIRSAEDKAVEEMAPTIRAAANDVYTTVNGSAADSIARAIYRAGYRKTGGE